MKKALLLLLLTATFNFFGQTISPLVSLCGESQVDLTSKNVEVLNGLDPNIHNISFHMTQVDALNNINAFANPTNFTATDGQIIYANVFNTIFNVSVVAKNFSVLISAPLVNNSSILADINCSTNGSISIQPSGGTPPYTYNVALNFLGGIPATQGVTSNVFDNLPAGNYTTWVMDSNGCVAFQNIMLVHTQPLNLYIAYLNSNSVAINGGQQPCQYILDNGSAQVWQSFSNLSDGTHTVSVVDANGCSDTISFTLPFVCDLTATINSTVICDSNKIEVNTTPINSANLTYTLFDNHNIKIEGPTSSNVFYINQAGSYSVLVEDGISCQVSVTFSIIDSVFPLTLNSTQINNTISLNATGGNAPYTYSLNGGSTFTTTSVFTGLQSSTYIAIVRDANTCTAQEIVTILPTSAGLVANDDVRNFSNPPVITPPLILNDTFNGNLITDTSNYNLTLLSVSPFTDSITLNQFGSIQINENTANGQYIVNYQLCTNGLPSICDTAIVTINVNNCNFDVLVGSTLDMPISTYIFTVNSPLVLVGPFQYTLDGGPQISIPTFNSNPTFSIPVAGLTSGLHTVRVTDLSTMCTVTVFFDVFADNKLTASAIATYVDNNNDGLTNVGDTVTYQFTVNNPTNGIAYNISLGQATAIGPNPMLTLFGENIPSLAIGESNSTNFTGVHVITQNDINQGFVFQFIGINGANPSSFTIDNYLQINTPLIISDGLKLNAFLDINGNGSQDNNEQNFPFGQFQKQLNGGLVQDISTNGVHYLYENNPANVYNFSFVINPDVASQYNPSTTNFTNVSVANNSGVTTLNFPITALPYSDLAVYLFAEQPRPGFTYFNTIVYKNEGNTTIPAGTLTFNKDNALSIINVSQSGITSTASGFTYDFTNLMPFESRTIYVNMQIPVIPIVNLGEILTNSANISIPVNDVNVTNNSSTLYQTIVGSFDPNDKAESHGGQIVKSGFGANDYLTYRIRFENTGTASAITVKVTDVLDSKLDETSIKMVGASHNYVLNRTGRNLEWKFDGINLPPSVENTQIGHGYVLFQVKPKPGFAVGDIISNIANIYFDFNPAIVTNESLTEFVTALSNNSFVFNNLKIYPNPAANILNINNDKTIDKIEISNVLDQTVLTKNINNFESKIDISTFTNGFYFVKVFSAGNEKTLKIVKE